MNNILAPIISYWKAQRRRLALYLVSVPIYPIYSDNWGSRILRRAISVFGSKARYFLSVYLVHMGRLRLALATLGEDNSLPSMLQARLRQCLEVLDRSSAPATQTSARSLPRLSFNGRVLLALHSALPRHIAGYSIRSHTILRALGLAGISASAVTRPGYPVDMDSGTATGTEDYDGQTYHHLPLPADPMNAGPDIEYIEGYADGIAQIAKEKKAGLIHGCSNFFNGLAAIEAAAKLGVPAIYEVRGLWYVTTSTTMPWLAGSDWIKYQAAMEQEAARRADLVVTLSTPLRDHIVGWDVPEERIAVIGNAVDTEKFAPRPHTASSVQGLRGTTTIGFIGSLTAYEGLDDLISAVEILVTTGRDVGLLVVGDGPERQRLEKRASRLLRDSRALFVGRVPPEKVTDYYAQCDILPLPRIDSPLTRLVSPLKPLEIMSMGKALIVSDLPAMQDAGVPDVTHLTCGASNPQSLAKSLDTLIEDRSLQELLGAHARDWVLSERSIERMGERYSSVYADL